MDWNTEGINADCICFSTCMSNNSVVNVIQDYGGCIAFVLFNFEEDDFVGIEVTKIRKANYSDVQI